LKATNSLASNSLLGVIDSNGIMGSSPAPSTQPTPADSHTSAPIPVPPASEFPGGMTKTDHKRPWIPKMDFPHFDGTDVRVLLHKCYAYFHLYCIPFDFRVTAAALHMVDKATHWF
jgi:hypothetical protein